MIRLYKQVADYVAFWMTYIRDQKLGENVDVRQYIYDTYGGRNYVASSNTEAQLHSLSRNFGGVEETQAEITAMLIGQAYLHANGIKAKHESDLIDQVVRLLNLPYGSSAIAGKTLDALRKAILVPEELAGLKARLDREEHSCANCGRGFVQNELAVIGRSSITGRISLFCAVCAQPAVCSCSSCKENKGVIQKLASKWLKRSTQCQECIRKMQNDKNGITEIRIGQGGAVDPEEAAASAFRPRGRQTTGVFAGGTAPTRSGVGGGVDVEVPTGSTIPPRWRPITENNLNAEMRERQAAQARQEMGELVNRVWGPPAEPVPPPVQNVTWDGIVERDEVWDDGPDDGA